MDRQGLSARPYLPRAPRAAESAGYASNGDADMRIVMWILLVIFLIGLAVVFGIGNLIF
ncbi:MAG TPA: hypothetical protein VGD76_11085 [Ramlibacter sp.]